MTDAQSLAPCGTEAAYRRHRRAGETPCQDCKRAAAAARARRRGKADEQPPQTMGSLAGEHLGGIVGPQELEQEPDGQQLEFAPELNRLYGVLGAAIQHAAPREAASIVREMRAILHDLRADQKQSSGGPSLKEQLAEAKRERAARVEARKVAALASGDVEGLAEAQA